MTDKFKQECKNTAYKNRLGKVELDNETISNSDYLSSVEITDSCISNGTILGNTNSKSIKVNTLGNYYLADKQINPFIGVKYDDSSEEYIKMGKYTITAETNDKTSKNGEYTGVDSLNKLDEVYKCSIENLKDSTVLDFYKDVCQQIGLKPKKLEFINQDLPVGGNPFTNNETCRVVLQNVAQVFCSFVDIDWETEEIDLIWFDDEYSETITKRDYSTLEKNQVYGPINSLSIKDSQIDGENVVIEQNGKDISSLKVEGKSEQDGTPTPESPVEIKTVKGIRNLLKNNIASQTINGITITKNEDGTIIANGTATATTVLNILGDETLTLNAGTYRLHGCPNGGGNSTYKIDIPVGGYPTDIGSGIGFILTELTTYNSIRLIIYSGAILDNLKFKPMVEESSVIHDYVPYGYWLQVKTTSGEQEQSTLIDMNKPNLFDKDNANVFNGYVNNNGVINLETARSIYVPIVGGKTYTITRNGSKRLRAITTDVLPSNGVSKIDIIHNDNASSITISTSTNSKYLVVYFYLTSDENDRTIEETLNTIKIYEGIGTDDYYELSSIGDTKDILTIQNGKAYINQKIGKVVLDGSESWASVGSNGYILQVAANVFPNRKISIYDGFVSHFKVEKSPNAWTGLYYCGWNNTGVFWVNDKQTLGSDLTNWKSWLSNNPVTVYYELAEPQTITLNGTYDIELFEGINNFTNNDELQPNMIITTDYIGNIEEYSGSYITIDKSIYELNEISIEDNYFLNTEELRRKAIDSIWNRIKNFSYIDCKITSYTGKPYLKRGNKIKVQDDDETYFDTYVLSHTFTYDGTFKSIIESPALTKTQTVMKNNKSLTSYFRKVERSVDKVNGKIVDVIEQVDTVRDDLNNNYYTIQKTNELIQTSGEGITNTFSEAGGNNVFRNTGLWFSGTNENWEYWTGNAKKTTNDKATLSNSMLLQNGTFSQKQDVPNGNYSVSFYYKLLNELATATVTINDVTYPLTSTDYKQFYTGEQDSDGNYITYPIEVSSNSLSISFSTDIDNSVEIYDLMANKGTVKLAYSQNENEITTDTVNISKGITITSSTTDTKFKADSDGIRIENKNTDEKTTKFTDKGMITKEAVVENEATIVKVLIQDINEQTWFTRL